MPSDKGAGLGLREVCHRTGLREHEVRYLQSKGHLKVSGRSSRRHALYAVEDIEFLTVYCDLRRSGVDFEEAVTIAEARAFGVTRVSKERLKGLIEQLTAGSLVRLRAATALGELLAGRINADSRGAA